MASGDVLERLPEAIATAESLPSPPTVALEVLRITRDDGADVQDLNRVLAIDPALSARILKLANSALYRRGEAVTSLEAATMRLGLKAVKLIALSFSLTARVARKPDDLDFDYADYWRRSLTMGVAGRALARFLGHSMAEEAFLCGLLGRIGQTVIARCLPREYAPVLEMTEGRLPTAAFERERLGFDFHEVGAALLARWELPSMISRTVLGWGDPDQLPADTDPSVVQLTRIMHAADLMSTVLCDPDRGACALSRLHAFVGDALDLGPEELDPVLVGLEESVSEMAAMLEVEIPSTSYQELVDRARAQLVQISLGTALDLEQTHHRAAELERRNLALASRANTDRLTGIPNRAHFDEVLERLIAEGSSDSAPEVPEVPEAPDVPEKEIGLLMVDIDHFKQFNDTHGHAIGDEVLKRVAQAMQSAMRASDVVARYGGEEFVVVLPETSLATLEAVAERLRARIEELVYEHRGDRLEVTVSVGGACTPRLRTSEEAAHLLAWADRRLYAAKAAGRNRCDCRRLDDLGSTTDRAR